MKKQKSILAVGTLIVDIITEKLDAIPDPGCCVIGEVSINLGGNAYSSSVNLKRLLTENERVICCSIIGSDLYGLMFRDSLRNESIELSLTEISGKTTSSNLIIQEKYVDRRYVFNPAVCDMFDFSKIITELKVHNPEIVVFGELPSIDLVGDKFIKLLTEVKSNFNNIIALDLLVTEFESYSWLCNDWDKIDILHCNIGEGRHVSKEENPLEIANWFSKQGVVFSIVTDGKNGAHCVFNSMYFHVPAFSENEVDATGAGDAMFAGFCSKILNELDDSNKFEAISVEKMIEFVRFGNACGAIAVQELGCVGKINGTIVNKYLKINS
ncbi:MAG: carbohydrate kinase family protein [Spirochaetaceae bacterium]